MVLKAPKKKIFVGPNLEKKTSLKIDWAYA